MTAPLLLVDGHWLFHRAYHAGKADGRWTAGGIPTWAAYGFVRSLLTATAERRPAAMAVAFDVSGPGRASRRRAVHPGYKATRPPMPDDQRSQLPLIREIVEALALPAYEVDGYEADDVIGTIARITPPGMPVEILTGDRDLFQIVRPGVQVLMPRRVRVEGGPALEVYDEAAVLDRMGVRPDQIADLKGLAGDASDNIPGVPRVGEKTAITLLEKFGSFDAIFADDRELYMRGLRGLLRTHRALALISRDLATIDCEVPLDFDLGACRLRRPDFALLDALLCRLEFEDLAAEFRLVAGAVA